VLPTTLEATQDQPEDPLTGANSSSAADLLAQIPTAFSVWASNISQTLQQTLVGSSSTSPMDPSPLSQQMNVESHLRNFIAQFQNQDESDDENSQNDDHDEDDEDDEDDDDGEVEGRSMSDSIMNECPVCQTSLDNFADVETRETHVADCLRKVSVGRGVGMMISGNRYIGEFESTFIGVFDELILRCLYFSPNVEGRARGY
jgi:hypothetical protein